MKKTNILHVIGSQKHLQVQAIFARRQVKSLDIEALHNETYFFENRQSVKGILKAYFDIRKIIKNSNVDIVHAHYGTMTAFISVMASNKPVAITFRGSDLNRDLSRSWLFDKIQKALSHIAANLSSVNICVSPALSRHLSYLKPEKVRVFPDGTDTMLFQPSEQKKAREKLGLDFKSKVILFYGRSPIIKGLKLAQQSVDLTKKRLDNVFFLNLDGSCKPENVPNYMNAADCFLMTSKYEGSPGIIREAMSCNLPVVSVDVGDVAVHLNGVSNSYICARTPESIAERLEQILQKCDRSDGREKCDSFSLETISKKLSALYNELQS